MSKKARFSPIAPISLIENLHDTNCLDGYLLILAHDVLEHKQKYVDLIAKMRAERQDTFIILDNSAVELPEPLLPDVVAPLADELGVDCYVQPDVIGDMARTLSLAADWTDTFVSHNIPVMKVPQGSTMEELIECSQILHQNMPSLYHPVYADLWSVPRWVANKFGSRKPLIQFLNQLVPDISIHLLGFSENYIDDMECTALPGVIGIDSANPCTLGQQALRYCMYRPQEVPHQARGSLWEHILPTPSTKANIAYVRQDMEFNNR